METKQKTTRRVTAQRKFAQGAYVPPTAVAAALPGTSATNNTNDRRETTTTGCTEIKNNVLHKHMAARSFLDMVSFHKSQSHLHPVVLLKRLPEEHQENEGSSEGEKRSVARKRKPKVQRTPENTKSVHSMQLRTRKQRNVPNKFSPLPNVIKRKYIRITRRSQPKHVLIRDVSTSTSEYSIDDNQPLTYYARNFVIPQDQSLLTPIAMGPPIPQSPLPRKKKRTRKNVPKYDRVPRPMQCMATSPPPMTPPLTTNSPQNDDSINPEEKEHTQQQQTQQQYIREPSIHIDSDSSDVEIIEDNKEEVIQQVREFGTHEISMTEYGRNQSTSHHTREQETDGVNVTTSLSCTVPDSMTNDPATIDYSIENYAATDSGTPIENPGFAPKITNVVGNYTAHGKGVDRWLTAMAYPKRPRTIDETSDFIDIETSVNHPGPSTSRRSSVDSIAIEKANAKAAAEREMKIRRKHEERYNLNEAPIFFPSQEEFGDDPIAYIEKIMPQVARYGICKIVPPDGFMPPCKCDDDVRFKTTNQYTSRLYQRWGTVSKEICAIKSCLKSQNIEFDRQPIFGGVEISLPKLYHLVQKHGGLETVTNNKKWAKIGEELIHQEKPPYDRNLEKLYFRYLLPYSSISPVERNQLLLNLEDAWLSKHRKLLQRANNPLHRQKVLLGDSEESESENDDETDEIEDCTTPGETMTLVKFKTIAGYVYGNIFRNKPVNTIQIEKSFWRTVLLGNDHICVNTASIDTSIENLGFTQNKKDTYFNHPWNLKVLSSNPRNVLRSLGRISGVTVPTLNLGMVFSSNCWHRDPHHLPYIEYLHSGSAIIRYGIPENYSDEFRRATEVLSPSSCQNKPLWLPSDITMVPPAMLAEQNVKIFKLEQNPGEFVLVMPRAYSCSISTGFTASESVYFAIEPWLDKVGSVFEETCSSCEPTMFALEHLLKSVAEDRAVSPTTINKVLPLLASKLQEEIDFRLRLERRGIKSGVKTPYDAPVVVEQSLSQRGSLASSSPSAPRTRARQTTSQGRSPRAVIRQPPPPPASTSSSNSSVHQPSPPPTTPPSPAWSFGNAAECEICRRMLYLSKVCKFPFGNGALCLQHAFEVLSKEKYKNIDIKSLEMHYRFSNKDLQDAILKAVKRVSDANLPVNLNIEIIQKLMLEV